MKNKKVLSLFVLVFAFTLTFSFIGFADDHKLDLGVVVTNISTTSQARVANAIKDYAKQEGWNDVTVLDSQGSVPTQADQVENLVTKGVDGIIMVMGHPRQIKDAMEEALAADIPVVTIDTGYMEGVVVDIKTDNFVLGSKITTYLFDRIGYEGNVIAFKFDKHFGVRRRGKVFDAELSEYEGVKLLAEHYMPASAGYMEDTRNTMQTYITQYGDKIDAVWCGFDELAYAVTDVLLANGYTSKNVIVTGVDGNQETFRRIRDKENPLVATVAQPFELEAQKAVDVLTKIVVDGMSEEEVVGQKRSIFVNAPLVDETNVPEKDEWPW